jgi:pimeloyl-ACP methyl ester carboxylesterase
MSDLIKDGKFEYIDKGEGSPLVLLHGLFGELSNFDAVIEKFSKKYRVLMPIMPLYKTKLKVGVGAFASYIEDFVDHMKLKDINLLGNSLGGHVALVYANKRAEMVKTLTLTGSSGLYEKAFGSDYPRKDDKEFLRKRISVTFYNQEFVTDELVDRCHSLVNDRSALINILRIAKSAIKHNMKEDLPNFKMPTLLIWGKNDNITPPEVAVQFNELMPNSTLNWIDKCGHAPMMEHPEEFNTILEEWLNKN